MSETETVIQYVSYVHAKIRQVKVRFIFPNSLTTVSTTCPGWVRTQLLKSAGFQSNTANFICLKTSKKKRHWSSLRYYHMGYLTFSLLLEKSSPFN